MNDPFEIESNINNDSEGYVTGVTVSLTLNCKPMGIDGFIKMEEVRAFETPANPGQGILARDSMIDILREQVLEAARDTAGKVSGRPAAAPAAAPVNPGSQAGTQAPAFGAAATLAVANGATPAPTDGWKSVPSRFGDGDIKFLTTAVYPSAKLEGEVNSWLQGKGLNPAAFKVWDNRPGPRGLEAGGANGCVAAVKISKEATDFVSPEVASSTIARVKFNGDGSLYIWLTKEAEAAIKFGALDRVKVA